MTFRELCHFLVHLHFKGLATTPAFGLSLFPWKTQEQLEDVVFLLCGIWGSIVDLGLPGCGSSYIC